MTSTLAFALVALLSAAATAQPSPPPASPPGEPALGPGSGQPGAEPAEPTSQPGEPPGEQPSQQPSSPPAPAAPLPGQGAPPGQGYGPYGQPTYPAAPQPSYGQPGNPQPPDGQPPYGQPPDGPPPHGQPAYPPQPYPGAYPGSYGPEMPPRDVPTLPPERTEVSWFIRTELGIGSSGVSENNQLLGDLGFSGPKMWVTVDGAYFVHPRVGLGAVMGMNRAASFPSDDFSGVVNNPTFGVEDYAYFIGGQVPVLLWGQRLYAFHATPRGGFLAGQVELDRAGGNADFNNTGFFGAALGFTSFSYHLTTNLSFLHAPAGQLGTIGRNHDFGGFYWSLGGTLDG